VHSEDANSTDKDIKKEYDTQAGIVNRYYQELEKIRK
jgi:hypothetical protein